MGAAVSSIHYPPSVIVQDGPHGMWTRYVMQVPANQVLSGAASGHRFAGPVDFAGGGFSRNFLHVSNVSPSAFAELAYTVYGAFSEPSTAPTSRNWLVMRGDFASGAAGRNNALNAVTVGGHVEIISPARSFLIRISSATAATAAINITLLSCKVLDG